MACETFGGISQGELKQFYLLLMILKTLSAKSTIGTTGRCEWTPARGGRAGGSPTPIAADARLLSDQIGSDTNCCKTEWPSTQRDRRKTRAETKAITDARGRFVKTLSQIGAQAEATQESRAAVRCPPA